MITLQLTEAQLDHLIELEEGNVDFLKMALEAERVATPSFESEIEAWETSVAESEALLAHLREAKPS